MTEHELAREIVVCLISSGLALFLVLAAAPALHVSADGKDDAEGTPEARRQRRRRGERLPLSA